MIKININFIKKYIEKKSYREKSTEKEKKELMIYTNEVIKLKKAKRRKLKNIIVAIVYIILIPLLVYNISLIMQSVINSEETPTFFGVKIYVIISGSMEPELDIGDIVIVKKEEDYEVGDVISFRQNQSIITHRISKIEEISGETYYKTKGDNNNIEDNWTITDSLIEGKVINVIPNVGNFVIMLKNKITIVIILILFYMYIVHAGSVEKKKRVRREKRVTYEENNEKV